MNIPSKIISTEAPTRINKYICASGICSRKAADTHIKRGAVLINGRLAKLGERVFFDDCVSVDGKTIEPLAADKTVCIVLNKPVDIVCTAAHTEKRNIVDFVGYSSRVFPVGRLDKNSQGLILLTNTGNLVNKILQSDNCHEKEYVVTVNKEVTNDFIISMSRGVPILGVVTKKCRVEKLSKFTFKIILIQGLNKQIRRMCKHLNYSVKKLERIRVMHLQLNGLPTGHWRELTHEELTELIRAVEQVSPDIPAR